MDMSDTLKCRRRVLENSAATALIAASIPPMPRPVTTRQIDRSTSPVTVVAMSMPPAMTARHPRIVGRRPILVGDAAEDDRADGHADEFHRQHDAERGPVDAPLRGDTG